MDELTGARDSRRGRLSLLVFAAAVAVALTYLLIASARSGRRASAVRAPAAAPARSTAGQPRPHAQAAPRPAIGVPANPNIVPPDQQPDPMSIFRSQDGKPPEAREIARVGQVSLGVPRTAVLENEAEVRGIMERLARAIDEIDSKDGRDPERYGIPYLSMLEDWNDQLRDHMDGIFYIASRRSIIRIDLNIPDGEE